MPVLMPRVSVLFITFNRIVTLRPTLSSFLASTDYPRDRLELICCDDCSPAFVQAELEAMPFDVHCLSKKRRGLGANVNQGLRAASGELILQIQDDWECRGPADYLRRAVASLQAAPEVGMVILNRHPNPLPVRGFHTFEHGMLRVFDNRPSVAISRVGEHAYTDWPHLKHRSFHEKLGLYAEGIPMWEMELEFSRRANAQTETFIADIEGMDVFEHIGEAYSYNRPWKKRVIRWVSGMPVAGPFLYRIRKYFRRYSIN